MARTKHRKDHNKALALRRTLQALEAQGRPPAPVMETDLRGRTRLSTTINDAAFYDGGTAPGTFEGCLKAFVDGQEVPAEVTPTGRIRLHEAPAEGAQVQIAGGPGAHLSGDYRHIEERLAAQFGISPDALGAHRAGVTVHLTPEQEQMIRDGKFLGVSMGYSHDGAPEIQGLDPAPLAGVSGPYHLEMAISQGEDGKPRFEEISICPGPDPNGVTDLKNLE